MLMSLVVALVEEVQGNSLSLVEVGVWKLLVGFFSDLSIYE